MRKLLSLLLLLSLPVNAETLTARDSTGNYVVITDTACKLQWLSKWKAATFFYEGKTYESCWTLKGQMIVILDSSGDLTAIPISMFSKENKT